MTSRTHTPEDVQKIMESWRNSESDYERGFIDGMQKQMQSSVDKAVNAMSQRTWSGLTDETLDDIYFCVEGGATPLETWREQARAIEAKLKEKNT
jgi:hypothetical protein